MSKRKNRHYPAEFKQQALELLATGDYSMAELERQLGITKGLLKDWRRKAEADDTNQPIDCVCP